MKICWVFMKIWIIFKSCCSLWHVENFRKYSNHLLKDILCVVQYQYCGIIAKTRLHSWKIIQIFSKANSLSSAGGHNNCNLPLLAFRGYFGSLGWWLCFIIVPSIHLLTEMVCITMLMAWAFFAGFSYGFRESYSTCVLGKYHQPSSSSSSSQ